MLALTIRQPWAWFILHAGKDVENRSWPTRTQGRILVHAAKGMTRSEYTKAVEMAVEKCGVDRAVIPRFEDLPRGGVVGSVEIVDCTNHSESPWYTGQIAYGLRDPKPTPFVQYPGQLKFFNIPNDLVSSADETETM